MSFLRERLKLREETGALRSLRRKEDTRGLVDFVSNDYLGLARSPELAAEILRRASALGSAFGATGSRLLSGNSTATERLEEKLARFHGTEAALLFNSGFDANTGLMSALLREGDTAFYDEKSH